MRIHLDRDLPIGLGEQLQAQVRLLIEGGQLQPGDPLPTAKTLAEREAVNVNTVAAAYAGLEVAGYVTQRKRAGTRVAADPPRSARGAFLAALGADVAARARALDVAPEELLRAVAAQTALASARPRFRVALLVENALQAEETAARAAALFKDGVELVSVTPDTYVSGDTHLTVVHPTLTRRLQRPAQSSLPHLDFDTDYPAPAD